MAGPSLIATLGANIAPFVAGMANASKHAQSEGEYIASALGGKLSGALAGIVSIEGVRRAISEAADYAGKIEDIHQQLDVSRESLQAWDLVLKQNGSNVEGAVKFFERLAVARQKALGGDDKAVRDFDKLGISIDELKKKRLQDLGLNVADAFQTGDPQQLLASLRAVGGKSATGLIPSFRQNFREAIEAAEASGISTQSVRELDAAGDAVTRGKHGFRAVVGELSGTFLTRMRDFGDLFSGNLSFKDALHNRGAALRNARAGGPPAAIEDTAEVDEFNEKAAAKEEARQKRIAALKEKIADAEDKARLKGMADDEKWFELKHREAKLRFSSVYAKDEEDRLKAKKELLDAEAETLKFEEKRDKAAEKADKKSRLKELKEEKEIAEDQVKLERGAREMEFSSLHKSGFVVGALANAPEFALLDVQKKSEQHLASIKKSIERLNAKPAGEGADDTEF